MRIFAARCAPIALAITFAGQTLTIARWVAPEPAVPPVVRDGSRAAPIPWQAEPDIYNGTTCLAFCRIMRGKDAIVTQVDLLLGRTGPF
jgi:hypothetical protein